MRNLKESKSIDETDRELGIQGCMLKQCYGHHMEPKAEHIHLVFSFLPSL